MLCAYPQSALCGRLTVFASQCNNVSDMAHTQRAPGSQVPSFRAGTPSTQATTILCIPYRVPCPGRDAWRTYHTSQMVSVARRQRDLGCGCGAGGALLQVRCTLLAHGEMPALQHQHGSGLLHALDAELWLARSQGVADQLSSLLFNHEGLEPVQRIQT